MLKWEKVLYSVCPYIYHVCPHLQSVLYSIYPYIFDAAFEGFTHDKSFYTSGCCDHCRRINHHILIHGTLLAIETDENAHVSYNKDDEIIRYDDLFMAIGTKFIFIRFNCDTNREERDAKTSLEHKIHALLECIAIQIARIEENENKELCDIVKLFYCAMCSKNGSDVCQCLKIVWFRGKFN